MLWWDGREVHYKRGMRKTLEGVVLGEDEPLLSDQQLALLEPCKSPQWLEFDVQPQELGSNGIEL